MCFIVERLKFQQCSAGSQKLMALLSGNLPPVLDYQSLEPVNLCIQTNSDSISSNQLTCHITAWVASLVITLMHSSQMTLQYSMQVFKTETNSELTETNTVLAAIRD